MKPFFLRKL
jgi:palmitoyltransferase ZDHHC13/17